MRRSAFTILELLMATVLLAMTLGLVTASFVRGGDAQSLRAATSIVRDLDARARVHAQRHGATALTVDRDPLDGTMRLAVVAKDEAIVFSTELPLGITVELRTDGGGSTLYIDARGHSDDAAVVIVGAAGSARLRVLGLSGQWIEDDGRLRVAVPTAESTG